MNMERFSLFHLNLTLLAAASGLLMACSLDANIQDLAANKTLPAEIRLNKDFQQSEVSRSGHYEVHGQVGEVAEKKVSGQYVIEGVIVYE